MTKEEFVEAARQHLEKEGLLEEKGCVLYSAFSTLKRGRFYILGLNPGGEDGFGTTIAESFDELPQYTGNAYLDEAWGKYEKKGEHPLQRHLKLLMEELGEDLKNVCASNLIFVRSKDQNGIENFVEEAEKCWPVHEMILDIVKPRVIIAFGNGSISPFNFLHSNKINGEKYMEDEIPAKWGNWKCRSFGGKIETSNETLDLLVLGIPHLSRYTVEGRQDVLNWLREKIKEHCG